MITRFKKWWQARKNRAFAVEVDKAKSIIRDIIVNAEGNHGRFIYYGYLKCNPDQKIQINYGNHQWVGDGFEEFDCRLVLPRLPRNRVMHFYDLDQVVCRGVTGDIVKAIQNLSDMRPYTRIEVESGSFGVKIYIGA